MSRRAHRLGLFRTPYKRLINACIYADDTVAGGEGDVVMYARARVRQEIEAARSRAVQRGGRPQSEDVFIKRLDKVTRMADALHTVETHPTVAVIVKALALGVGDERYRLQLEHSLLTSWSFEQEKRERDVADDASADARHHRLLLHAIAPLAEKLMPLHDDSLSTGAKANAMASRRSTTSGQILDMTSSAHVELVFVETDDTLLRQVIYLRCDPFDFNAPRHYIETREVSHVPRCVAHAEFLSVAERLVEAIKSETALHRSRATVLVGYGVAGAVAQLVAIILKAEGYTIRNVIAFGAARCFTSVQQRDVTALNPVRVEIVDDLRPSLPVESDNREPFIHIGESLVLQSRAAHDVERSQTEGVTMQAYLSAIQDPKVVVVHYGDGENDEPLESTSNHYADAVDQLENNSDEHDANFRREDADFRVTENTLDTRDPANRGASAGEPPSYRGGDRRRQGYAQPRPNRGEAS